MVKAVLGQLDEGMRELQARAQRRTDRLTIVPESPRVSRRPVGLSQTNMTA
jgi:hypothetical protein